MHGSLKEKAVFIRHLQWILYLPLENNDPALSLYGVKFDIIIGLIRSSHEETNLVPIKSSVL